MKYLLIEPNRAQEFYEQTFGWKFNKWEGPGPGSAPMDYWMIKTGEEGTAGINGGLSKRMPGYSGGMTNVIDVPSVMSIVTRFRQMVVEY